MGVGWGWRGVLATKGKPPQEGHQRSSYPPSRHIAAWRTENGFRGLKAWNTSKPCRAMTAFDVFEAEESKNERMVHFTISLHLVARSCACGCGGYYVCS